VEVGRLRARVQSASKYSNIRSLHHDLVTRETPSDEQSDAYINFEVLRRNYGQQVRQYDGGFKNGEGCAFLVFDQV
jgi:hypothetical protein